MSWSLKTVIEFFLIIVLIINWFTGGGFTRTNTDIYAVERTVILSVIVLLIYLVVKFLIPNKN